MRAVPPLSVRATMQAHATAELARELVHLLLDRERTRPDPFALALRRYRMYGEPEEVGGRWRQLLVAVDRLATVRRLDRDLLDSVLPRAIRVAASLPVAVGETIPTWRVTTYVVAGPFDSADRVDALTERILRAPGVRYASVVLFGEGMAAFEVVDTGTGPLASRLGDALEIAPIVISGVPAEPIWSTTPQREVA